MPFRSIYLSFSLLFLNSCFLIKIPVPLKKHPIKDSVNVYHFIVSGNKNKIADTALANSFIRESKKAYDWISEEASRKKQRLIFKEYWPVNKDTNLKNTFIHKLPSSSVQRLLLKNYFKVVTRKKTKNQEEKIEKINWKNALFDSITKQIKDSSICNIIKKRNLNKSVAPNQLIVIHLIKAKKSKINGFYSRGETYIGHNKSRTIAHESIHYLGAPDLYIHKYWFGKRRRLVKKELRQEVMNTGIGKNYDCTTYYISDYTAYTIGWTQEPEKENKPLLKQNLMAKIVFFISLIL